MKRRVPVPQVPVRKLPITSGRHELVAVRPKRDRKNIRTAVARVTRPRSGVWLIDENTGASRVTYV
jgi:hypothetical protein